MTTSIRFHFTILYIQSVVRANIQYLAIAAASSILSHLCAIKSNVHSSEIIPGNYVVVRNK